MPRINSVQGGLRLIPLGGFGEIGLNMIALEYEDSIIVIDCGLMFPDDYMLGVDVVVPDFTYLSQNRDKIKCIILTHGHEDHIGAMPYFLRMMNPLICGTRFTVELVKEKLKEHQLPGKPKFKIVKPRQILEFGPFKIEFIRVSHSIAEGLGLGIETPEGIIVHSGDFKIDFTPVDGKSTDLLKFAEYGDRGVLAFLCDSTNVEREGYTISERDIGNTLEKVMRDCTGRVIVGVFASNVHRIQQVIDIAQSLKRKVVLDGKSIITNVRLARKLGIIKTKEHTLIDLKKAGQMTPSEIVMITTGSQGEPMSVLSRLASATHAKINIEKGDTVVLSSKFIPGNERAITGVINALYRQGADVIYEKISAIHTSGHAHKEELKILYKLTRPKYFVPCHGEYRHLIQHARLARSMGHPKSRSYVIENGQVLRFMNRRCKHLGKVPTGRIFVDGKGFGDVGDIILDDRKILSQDGVVTMTMILSKTTHQIIYGPALVSRGFAREEENPTLLVEAQAVVRKTLAGISWDNELDWPQIKERFARDLRRYFNKKIKRRPVVIPTIAEV